MKRNHKKSLLLLIAAAVVMMACVGVSVAYLVADTDPVTNSFTPAEVTTTTEENFDETVKKNVKVTNTGNVAVYVRACVVANWCDAVGNIVAPWEDDIAYNKTNWTKVGDYWYYKGTVAPGKSTENLFASYSYTLENIPVGADHLEMNVMHQSVQAEPEDAIKELWGDAALKAVKGQ